MRVQTTTGTRRRADEIQFRLIYLTTLPAFLLRELVVRLLPTQQRVRAGAGQSVFGGAKAAARTCGSFALMG